MSNLHTVSKPSNNHNPSAASAFDAIVSSSAASAASSTQRVITSSPPPPNLEEMIAATTKGLLLSTVAAITDPGSLRVFQEQVLGVTKLCRVVVEKGEEEGLRVNAVEGLTRLMQVDEEYVVELIGEGKTIWISTPTPCA